MKKFFDPEAEYIEIDALISTYEVSGDAGDIGGGETGDENESDFFGGGN